MEYWTDIFSGLLKTFMVSSPVLLFSTLLSPVFQTPYFQPQMHRHFILHYFHFIKGIKFSFAVKSLFRPPGGALPLPSLFTWLILTHASKPSLHMPEKWGLLSTAPHTAPRGPPPHPHRATYSILLWGLTSLSASLLLRLYALRIWGSSVLSTIMSPPSRSIKHWPMNESMNEWIYFVSTACETFGMEVRRDPGTGPALEGPHAFMQNSCSSEML